MDRAATIAHRPRLAGSTGCGWLMPAAEMAGLAGGSWRSPPDPARTGWACPPRIATRALEAEARSVRAARYFTVAILRRRGMAERGPDIAIVVSELLTNALRHALPRPGDTRAGRPVRLGLPRPGPCVLCAVADPGTAAPAPRTPGSLAETGRGLHIIGALSDQWGYTNPRRYWQGHVDPVRPAAGTAAPGPVPTQARPRPVAEPGSPAGRGNRPAPHVPSAAGQATSGSRWLTLALVSAMPLRDDDARASDDGRCAHDPQPGAGCVIAPHHQWYSVAAALRAVLTGSCHPRPPTGQGRRSLRRRTFGMAAWPHELTAGSDGGSSAYHQSRKAISAHEEPAWTEIAKGRRSKVPRRFGPNDPTQVGHRATMLSPSAHRREVHHGRCIPPLRHRP